MRLGQLASSVRFFFLLCNLTLVSPLFGQEHAGSITGRALDRAGAILQGAHVEIEPSGIATATNAQGEFTVTALAPGSYSVTVSYVGFTPFTTKVDVSAGQAKRVSAQLNVAPGMERVNVTERIHGEVEAINRARESDNILQVLPVEVITSLPNANIADALGRLPSVTLERDEG